ncbi:hypothetical protein BJ741DRAFT_624926, partial [Chytriomyces cf. hyalinus JEL632]
MVRTNAAAAGAAAAAFAAFAAVVAVVVAAFAAALKRPCMQKLMTQSQMPHFLARNYVDCASAPLHATSFADERDCGILEQDIL